MSGINLFDEDKIRDILGMDLDEFKETTEPEQPPILNKLIDLDDDDFINNVVESVDEPHNQPINRPPTSNGMSTADEVYSELNTLISNGSDIMATLQSVILASPNNPELYSGASSLMTSIKDTMKEFTKIHFEGLKHSNQMEIEQMKIDARRELHMLRSDGQTIDGVVTPNSATVSYSQEQLVRDLIAAEREESS